MLTIYNIIQKLSFQKKDIDFIVRTLLLLLLWNFSYQLIQTYQVNPADWVTEEGTLFRSLISNHLYIVIIGLTILLFFINHTAVFKKAQGRISWKNEKFKGTRYLISAICAIIVYHFSFADINLYANNAFIIDRISLIILGILAYINPLFLFSFIVYAYNFNLQYSLPLGWNSYHHFIFPVAQFLVLYSTYIIIKALDTKFDAKYVIFLGFIMMGATYYLSGFGKLFFVSSYPFEWLTKNHTVYLIAGAYIAYDWWGFIPQEIIKFILNFLDFLDPLLNLFTIIAEMGIVLGFFLSRKITIFFLLLIVIFHIGIFITTGLLFRMWLIVDIGLLIIILIQDPQTIKEFYRVPIALFAAIVMISGFLLPTVKNYSWWDTGIYTNLDYLVTTTDNQTYVLPRQFLLPYEDLNRGRYNPIINQPTPKANNLGAGDYYFWKSIENLNNPNNPIAINNAILQVGKNQYNEKSKQKFKNLLVKSLQHYNQRNLNKQFLAFPLKFPPHYSSMPNLNYKYYHNQGQIKEIEIVYRLNFYNRQDNQFYLIKKEPIYTFSINSDSKIGEHNYLEDRRSLSKAKSLF